MRSKNNISPLTTNINLTQCLNRWASAIRGIRSEVFYLQICGFVDIQVYEFEAIKKEFVIEVVEEECKECYSDKFRQIAGIFSEEISGDILAYVVVVGGLDANVVVYDKQKIDATIQRIEESKKVMKHYEDMIKNAKPLEAQK